MELFRVTNQEDPNKIYLYMATTQRVGQSYHVIYKIPNKETLGAFGFTEADIKERYSDPLINLQPEPLTSAKQILQWWTEYPVKIGDSYYKIRGSHFNYSDWLTDVGADAPKTQSTDTPFTGKIEQLLENYVKTKQDIQIPLGSTPVPGEAQEITPFMKRFKELKAEGMSPEQARQAYAGEQKKEFPEKYEKEAGVPITDGYGPSSYAGVSVVDYLKSLGKESSFTSRTELASQLGITNYTGSAEQNTQMLGLLRGGVTPTLKEGEGIKDDITGGFTDLFGTSDEARAEEKETEEKKKKQTVEEIKDDQSEVQKLTAKVQLKNLREQLGLDPDTGDAIAKPGLPSFTDDFEALRSEQGVTALETQINSVESQIRNTEASLRQGMYTEEGKLKPMELMGIKQRELTRQAQEALDTLNRRKQTLVDELGTKNALISDIMKYKGMDYTASSTAYNQQFSQNIQLLNILENRATKAEQEDNRQKDDARANLKIITDLIQDGIGAGTFTASNIPQALTNSILKLESQAGLPRGFTGLIVSSMEPDEKVLAYKWSKDETQVTTLIQKADGSIITKTTLTGLPEAVGGDDLTDAEQKRQAVGNMSSAIAKHIQGRKDAYLSPEEWKVAKQQWRNEGFSAIDFIKEFLDYINPYEPRGIEVYGVEEAGFVESKYKAPGSKKE